MAYADRIRKRWVVVRLLPKMQHRDEAYFFKYTDAIDYTEILRKLDPGYQFEVMFEAGVEASTSARVDSVDRAAVD